MKAEKEFGLPDIIRYPPMPECVKTPWWEHVDAENERFLINLNTVVSLQMNPNECKGIGFHVLPKVIIATTASINIISCQTRDGANALYTELSNKCR